MNLLNLLQGVQYVSLHGRLCRVQVKWILPSSGFCECDPPPVMLQPHYCMIDGIKLLLSGFTGLPYHRFPLSHSSAGLRLVTED